MTQIDEISQVVSAIPPLMLTSEVVSIPEDEVAFVSAYETNNEHLVNNTVPELNALKTQFNTSVGQINTVAQEIQDIGENAINAITFNDIATLKLNSNMGRVDVLGYYAKGDGGGGTFYWDSASTETDNGGTTIQATGVATGRWKRVFSGAVNVKWFGAKGDGVADDTVAIQNAINTQNNIYVPTGIYNVTTINIPSSFSSHKIQGEGFYHYHNTKSTIIKSINSTSMFILQNGADLVSIQDIKLYGNSTGTIGIDGTYGSFLSLTNVGIYNFTQYGVYSKQGLGRYNKCFFSSNNIGLHLYSDSSVTDSEFTGGTTPIKIVAGGNRLSNVWANSGADSCIELSPFDNSTTHINTSMVNIYAGEVESSTLKNIIKIVGTSTQKVQQVQLSNSHIVNSYNSANKINTGIYCEYVDNSVFSNIAFMGQGDYATSTKYTENFIKLKNTNGISIGNNAFYKCNKNSIYVDSGNSNINISNNTFNEFATLIGTGNECAAIYVSSGFVTISSNSFNIAGSQTSPYACYSSNANNINFADNTTRYPSTNIVIVGTGTFSGTYLKYGSSPIITNYSIKDSTFNKVYLSRGQINAAGSSTTIITAIPSVAENQSYLITIRQAGSGSNSMVGIVFSYNASIGAYRLKQSNTDGGALDMNITTSSGNINLVLGSGYGSTTWDWVLTRLG